VEELAKTGSTVNKFRYAGEQWDANAGFYFNRARWYSPDQGRFTSVDPYGGDPQSPVSLHRYLYANVSPINVKDPSGRFSLIDLTVTIAILDILNASARIGINLSKVEGAYFAERPLKALQFDPENFIPLIEYPLDWIDREPIHENIFYFISNVNDNVGFFNMGNNAFVGPGEVRSDPETNLIKNYRKTLIGFRPLQLKEAVRVVKLRVEAMQQPSWHLLGYNCQSFCTDVRAEYYHIIGR
jgi:RHS repeat-associated protein